MSTVAEREFMGFKSSVLLVGHPDPDQVAFGADFAANNNEAIEKLSKSQYPVLVTKIEKEFVLISTPLGQPEKLL